MSGEDVEIEITWTEYMRRRHPSTYTPSKEMLSLPTVTEEVVSRYGNIYRRAKKTKGVDKKTT